MHANTDTLLKDFFSKVGITTALPVIVHDLGGEEFEWVGSAYALSATAFLPLSGALAQVMVYPMYPEHDGHTNVLSRSLVDAQACFFNYSFSRWVACFVELHQV